MTGWTRVKWTEAGQLTALLAWTRAEAQDLRVSPETFFTGLRAQGRLDEAAMFLGQALPRFEAVSWAVQTVHELVPAEATPSPTDTEALQAALAWIKDPSEPRRRAAFDASGRASDDCPERFAALAAFFSGGSLAPDDCPPVPAPREAAGKFAAAAVILAATRSANREAALARALDIGESLTADRNPPERP